jgi:Transposase IS66 family
MDCLSEERARQYERMHERLLRHGEAHRIFPLQKGASHTGSEEARKLLNRLQKHQTRVTPFPFRDPHTPFDNNQAEQDVRMSKIEQRISGTFRGKEDVYVFCLCTASSRRIKKQKKPIWDTFQQLL